MGVFVRDHPDREALFEYAEQLEAGRAAFGSELAVHVRDCVTCAAEVRTMRRSLALTESVKTLEPTDALQASVILAMKSQRLTETRLARRRALKSATLAAGFMLMFGAVFQTGGSAVISRDGVIKIGPTTRSAFEPFALEALYQDSPEERLLGPALNATYWRPGTAWEQAQQRALQAMDAEIEEALAALQSNPALARAGAVVNSNRELKRQTLKTLYAQRTL